MFRHKVNNKNDIALTYFFYEGQSYESRVLIDPLIDPAQIDQNPVIYLDDRSFNNFGIDLFL